VQTFWTWLLSEDRERFVEPGVLQGYEQAFKAALRGVIERTKDPALMATFQKMLDCPIQDRRGNCRSFSSYIVDALVKNGIQHQYDMEAALQYVVEKMLLERTDAGEQRATVFSDFDESRPYEPGQNPLQARFMKFLEFAIRNIRKGKIVRLRKAEARPVGTVSIGVGRSNEGDPHQGLPAEQLPARPSTDVGFGEIVADIVSSLRQKEPAYGLPLVAVFQAMIAGQRSEARRQTFGDRAARTARQVVIRTIEEYAKQSDNYALMRLVQRFQAGEPVNAPRQARKPAVPRLEPGKEKDFASIVSVIDRFGGRAVGSSDLGKYRRRWLDYPPRGPTSGYRNRLEEVLAKMAQESVLKATRMASGATVYSPGPNYEKYRQPALVGQEG